MALSRFRFSEAEFQLTKEGFSRSRRRFSVSLPPPPESKVSKESESSEERKTEDEKSFLQRDREENPGVFPEVLKAVGGSFNIFMDIVSKYRNKLNFHPSVTMPQGEKESFTKICSNENLKESMDEISSVSEQTEQCSEVLNDTISSSNTSIEVLAENSLAPPIDEEPQNLDLDYLKIGAVAADGKNIDSELSTKKRGLKQRKHLNGSNIRCSNNVDARQNDDLRGVDNTYGLDNIIKLLQNGPKDSTEAPIGKIETPTKAFGTGTSDWLGSMAEGLSEGRKLNGTEGSSMLKKENRKLSLLDVLKSKPDNGVDDMLKTTEVKLSMQNTTIREENGGRERNEDDSGQFGSMFSQILTTTEVQPGTNTGSSAHRLHRKKSRSSHFKALNMQNVKKKDAGRISDLFIINSLSNKGKNEEETEDEDNDSNIAAPEYRDLRPATAAPIAIHEDTSKYVLFVRFLDEKTSVSDVCREFDRCGPLHEVQFAPSRKLGRYKCAYVFFKAEQGLKNALNNTDPVICNADVVVQPMASQLSSRLRIDADVAVQDADFPAHLLKYPSRSVAVKGLTANLSFDHLRYALGLWGPISGVAIGQSESSIYVEFESEETKEKVLEAASVTVLGKKLQIHRVDAPKTTVVRISKVNSQTDERTVRRISNIEGKVKRVVQRGSEIFDVHFKLCELPNMLNILNSLNGLVIDKSQWVAQPATFIPVGIIQSLWDDPEGRKQVREIFQKLCTKVERDRSSINSFDYIFLGHCENST